MIGGDGMNEFFKRKNIFYFVIIALSLIVAIVLCIDYSKTSKNSTPPSDASAKASSEPKKEKVLVTVNVETIEDGLQNMGTLITQEYYFTQVETYSKEKKVFGLINSSSEFTYSYDGIVTAGINFEDVHIEKNDKDKTLTVNIPPSELQSVNIDTDTFKIYSENDSIWNPMGLEDYNLSLTSFEDTARKKALESGILERSDEQARRLVENFLMSIPSISGYKVAFE